MNKSSRCISEGSATEISFGRCIVASSMKIPLEVGGRLNMESAASCENTKEILFASIITPLSPTITGGKENEGVLSPESIENPALLLIFRVMSPKSIWYELTSPDSSSRIISKD
ncbi:MAG: hypothetical protein KAQ69_06895 [Spirochaetales bacterium]|nr:hypothetical protein [Spirochaetales bacterium]